MVNEIETTSIFEHGLEIETTMWKVSASLGIIISLIYVLQYSHCKLLTYFNCTCYTVIALYALQCCTALISHSEYRTRTLFSPWQCKVGVLCMSRKAMGLTSYIQKTVLFLLNKTTPICIDYQEQLVNLLLQWNVKINSLLTHTYLTHCLLYSIDNEYRHLQPKLPSATQSCL